MARPILIVNPRSDGDFVAFAEEQLDAAPLTVEAMEAALRLRYPHATVRERDLAAEATTWYVYREGRWIPNAT